MKKEPPEKLEILTMLDEYDPAELRALMEMAMSVRPNMMRLPAITYHEYATHRADAMRYTLTAAQEARLVSSYSKGETPKMPEGIDDIDKYVEQRTIRAETIISDRDFRLMSPKEAQGYVTKALYGQINRKLELALTVREEKDMNRMQTKYSAEVVVLTKKDLQKLLQEVADRCAP